MKKIFTSLSNNQKGILLMLSSVSLIAFSIIITRYIVNIYNPSVYNMLFWSVFGAFLLSLPYILSSKQQIKIIKNSFYKYPKLISIILFLSVVSTVIWFFLIHSISSDTVSLFDQTAVLWGLFLGVFFLHERITLFQVFAFTLSAIGIFIVVRGEIFITPSTLFFLICNPLLYVLQSLAMKKYGEGVDGMALAVIRAFGMTVSFGVIFGLMGEISVLPFYLFLFLGLIQFLGMIVGKALYFKAHEYLPMSQLNFFFLLIPIFALLASPFIESDYIHNIEKYIGAVITLAGVFLFMWKGNK